MINYVFEFKSKFLCEWRAHLLVRVAGLEPVHLSAQEPKGHATWQQYIEKRNCLVVFFIK